MINLQRRQRATRRIKLPGSAKILLLVGRFFAAILLLVILTHAAQAQDTKTSHGIALFGALKYPANFQHFEYVNPDAPKGGLLKLADLQSFDTLNAYITKGVKAPGVKATNESLMVSSLDEPQSMYGLVAESITRPEDNSFAEFTLRKEARWHDGTPITPDDVVFSFDILKTKGDPGYRILYQPIASVEKTGERGVRFTFSDPKNRELALIAGSMPILSKAYFSTRDFEKSSLEPILGSGPYKVKSVNPGRTIIYERVADYWGKDLPVNRGGNNFGEIRYDVYLDETVALEALKGGEYDFRQEYIARNWATAYKTPAISDGRIVKREIHHEIPQGMQGFFYNIRRPKLSDARVREAIGLAMDYEWLNKTLFYGAYKRNRSYFQNTSFSATGVPKGEELALLEPFRKELPPTLFTEEFNPPRTDGSGNARENLLKADKLLTEAGWIIKDGKRVNAKTGEALTLEFLLNQPTMQRPLGPIRKNLDRLGIGASVRLVDDAQYQLRLDDKDFDIISHWINRGVFFPGNEQTSMWLGKQADIKGSENLVGVKSPVVDALIATLTAAKNEEELRTAARALDRVLQWGHYTIPHWHSNSFRVAYWNKFGIPKVQPKYDIGIGNWWVKK